MIRPVSRARYSGSAQPGDNLLGGRVAVAMFMGEAMEYQVEMPGETMMRLELHASNLMSRGDTIRIQTPPSQCRTLLG